MKRYAFPFCFQAWPAALILAISLPFVPLRADILIKDGQKVAFLGDSITAHGWERSGGYVHLVVAGLAAEGVKIVPIPAGVSGNTSNNMLARLDRDVLSKQPDWMTLSCGVNDVMHRTGGVDLAAYQKNITSIVDQAQARGIRVMIFTATVTGEDLSNADNQKLAAYNDFLRQLAKERNLPLADLNPAFQNAIGAAKAPAGTLVLTADGVHPNPDGYRVMAREILKALGVPKGDLPKIEQAWNAIRDGAVITVRIPMQGNVPLTFSGYDSLKQAAAAKGTTVPALANAAYLRAVRQTLDAHSPEDSVDMNKLQAGVDQAFARELEALAGASSQAPSPAPRAANP